MELAADASLTIMKSMLSNYSGLVQKKQGAANLNDVMEKLELQHHLSVIINQCTCTYYDLNST